MATITVMLNYLGTPISREYLDRIYDGDDHSWEVEYHMIRQVLELPLEHLPREVLERYVEVSGKEAYTAIFPHTDKLFERFILPFKSAKRMYCFGEYLASIELSAHLGEMLALLIWEISPISVNGKNIDIAMEKAIWGKEFEKFGQDQRINLLQAFGAVSEIDARLLDHLRATRRKYFHFWSTPVDRMRDDALDCFLKVSALVNSVLKIEYENGSVKLNPLLEAYLATHETAL